MSKGLVEPVVEIRDIGEDALTLNGGMKTSHHSTPGAHVCLFRQTAMLYSRYSLIATPYATR